MKYLSRPHVGDSATLFHDSNHFPRQFLNDNFNDGNRICTFPNKIWEAILDTCTSEWLVRSFTSLNVAFSSLSPRSSCREHHNKFCRGRQSGRSTDKRHSYIIIMLLQKTMPQSKTYYYDNKMFPTWPSY